MRTARFFLVPLLLLLAHPKTEAQTQFHVRDSNASFIDVASRRKALASLVETSAPPRLQQALRSVKSCNAAPPPAPPPPNEHIPGRYLSGSHGAIDPDEHTASEPYYKVQQVAAEGANNYLVSGNPAEAACVLKILLPWVHSHALLDYDAKSERQVWYQSTWATASLALSVSIIRAEPTLNPADRDVVIAWLHDAARHSLNESQGPISTQNNHFFWRGLMATAVGVISQDNELFNRGIGIYATALSELSPDGTFPLEMARHELALHYQAFAIEPLVLIAELALGQGYNLYPLEEDHHKLADAVAFLNRAIANPAIVRKYAVEDQKLEFNPGSTQLSWLEFYNARFPSSDWSASLAKPFFDLRLAGSTTLYAAPVSTPITPPGPSAPPGSK